MNVDPNKPMWKSKKFGIAGIWFTLVYIAQMTGHGFSEGAMMAQSVVFGVLLGGQSFIDSLLAKKPGSPKE